jgi:hypothetical protein
VPGSFPTTRERIDRISRALQELAAPERFGGWPPSDHRPWTASPNDTNLGSECVFLLLHRWDLCRPFELDLERLLGNTDEDRPVSLLPGARDIELYEFVDGWGNPLVYFGPDDLAAPRAVARIMLADGRVVEVCPRIDPVTDQPLHRERFQLFSAGPDGAFNTADDIGN